MNSRTVAGGTPAVPIHKLIPRPVATLTQLLARQYVGVAPDVIRSDAYWTSIQIDQGFNALFVFIN